MSMQPPVTQDELEIALDKLSESLAKLRRVDGDAVRVLRESLLRHGQFVPVMAYRPQKDPQKLEVVDGFKRLCAARALGWSAVRVSVVHCSDAQAKAAVSMLNQGQGLSALEEAWVVRALYREEKLNQPQIGQLLNRDKSWVCRRLLLAEGLGETIQMDVRLGLLSARSAEMLARLPRVNQAQACEYVQQQGLTCQQTERLVTRVLALPEQEREVALEVELSGAPERDGKPERDPPKRGARAPAQKVEAELALLTKGCGRMQALLLATPLCTLGPAAAQLIRQGLTGLLPVLSALQQTLERVMESRDDEKVEQSSGA